MNQLNDILAQLSSNDDADADTVDADITDADGNVDAAITIAAAPEPKGIAPIEVWGIDITDAVLDSTPDVDDADVEPAPVDADEDEEDVATSEIVFDDDEDVAAIAAMLSVKAVRITKSVGVYGNRRTISAKRNEIVINGADVRDVRGDWDEDEDSIDLKRTSHSVKIITCDSYNAVLSLDASIDKLLDSRAIWCEGLKKGTRILPIGLVEWWEETWANYCAEREALIDAYCAEHPEEMGRAKRRLSAVWTDAWIDDVETVRSRFRATMDYLPEEVPNPNLSISPRAMARAQANIEEKSVKIAAEARLAIREMLLGLLDNLREMLEPKDDGKAKRMYASNVENLSEFLDLFEKRNITDDAATEKVVGMLRQLIKPDADAEGIRDRLRDDDGYREMSAQALDLAIDRMAELTGELDDGGAAFDFDAD